MIDFLPQKNRWCMRLGFFPDYYSGGGMIFVFAFYKMHALPPVGEMAQRKLHYKGFFIEKRIREFILINRPIIYAEIQKDFDMEKFKKKDITQTFEYKLDHSGDIEKIDKVV